MRPTTMVKGFLLLFLISPLGLFNGPSILVAGYIFCHCDTAECRAAGMHECRAEFYCYTMFQVIRPEGALATAEIITERHTDRVVLSRGCVANGLMSWCEKRERQPGHSRRMVSAQCCRDAWCNSDKLLKTAIDSDRDAEMHEEDKRSLANQSVTRIGFHGFENDPLDQQQHRKLQVLDSPLSSYSSSSSRSSFDSRTRDMSAQQQQQRGRSETAADSATLNRNPAEERRQLNHHLQQPQQQQQTRSLRFWSALFNRPILITTSVAFVLLTFVCLILFILLALCRRQRTDRKRLHSRSIDYTRASHTYDGIESGREDDELEAVKLPTTSWALTSWTCCHCRRLKPNSLYDYCHPDERRRTSDSIFDQKLEDQKVTTRLDSDLTGSKQKANDLRRALIRAPVVPSEQKTSVWIEKQQQQQQITRLPVSQLPPGTSQFSASLSPGSSAEFSYPRCHPDQLTTPGTSAHFSAMVMVKPWPVDNASGPDESIEAMTTDAQRWTLYSGPSLDTENSEGRDERSECTELSGAHVRVPVPIRVVGNTINGRCETGRVPIYPCTNSLHNSHLVIEYQRQRGTGATSSAGEESRLERNNDLAEWSRQPGTQSTSSQSEEHSAQKLTLAARDLTHETAKHSQALIRRSSTKLIALTNFRKAEDSSPDLVTPYAQFQLSPEPSVHEFR